MVVIVGGRDSGVDFGTLGMGYATSGVGCATRRRAGGSGWDVKDWLA